MRMGQETPLITQDQEILPKFDPEVLEKKVPNILKRLIKERLASHNLTDVPDEAIDHLLEEVHVFYSTLEFLKFVDSQSSEEIPPISTFAGALVLSIATKGGAIVTSSSEGTNLFCFYVQLSPMYSDKALATVFLHEISHVADLCISQLIKQFPEYGKKLQSFADGSEDESQLSMRLLGAALLKAIAGVGTIQLTAFQIAEHTHNPNIIFLASAISLALSLYYSMGFDKKYNQKSEEVLAKATQTRFDLITTE